MTQPRKACVCRQSPATPLPSSLLFVDALRRHLAADDKTPIVFLRRCETGSFLQPVNQSTFSSTSRTPDQQPAAHGNARHTSNNIARRV